MVRATLERVLGADRLELWYERTAEKPYTRALLFSTVDDVRSPVVFCVQPSVRAASLAPAAAVGPSMVSVYNKRNGWETRTSAALVRSRARAFAPWLAHMGGARAPGRAGYRVNMVDGHGLAAREHRLKVLREAPGRAWPGTALVVYEPAHGLGTAVFPCEDGPAQERALLGAVLQTVAAHDRWSADRHVCTRAWLCARDTRGGFLVLRQHHGWPFEIFRPRRSAERTRTGTSAQPRVGVVDEHDTQDLDHGTGHPKPF
jgi:hypothetical protein